MGRFLLLPADVFRHILILLILCQSSCRRLEAVFILSSPAACATASCFSPRALFKNSLTAAWLELRGIHGPVSPRLGSPQFCAPSPSNRLCGTSGWRHVYGVHSPLICLKEGHGPRLAMQDTLSAEKGGRRGMTCRLWAVMGTALAGSTGLCAGNLLTVLKRGGVGISLSVAVRSHERKSHTHRNPLSIVQHTYTAWMKQRPDST